MTLHPSRRSLSCAPDAILGRLDFLERLHVHARLVRRPILTKVLGGCHSRRISFPLSVPEVVAKSVTIGGREMHRVTHRATTPTGFALFPFLDKNQMFSRFRGSPDVLLLLRLL